jgi:hypothetical protein
MDAVILDEDNCKQWMKTGQGGKGTKFERPPPFPWQNPMTGSTVVEGYVDRAQVEDSLCCPISQVMAGST